MSIAYRIFHTTPPDPPDSSVTKFRINSPVRTSHNFTVPSSDDVMTKRESNCKQVTADWCLFGPENKKKINLLFDRLGEHDSLVFTWKSLQTLTAGCVPHFNCRIGIAWHQNVLLQFHARGETLMAHQCVFACSACHVPHSYRCVQWTGYNVYTVKLFKK